MTAISIRLVVILALRTLVMTDQMWERGFEGASGLVSASPESDLGQV